MIIKTEWFDKSAQKVMQITEDLTDTVLSFETHVRIRKEYCNDQGDKLISVKIVEVDDENN